ncbi:MAG: efflux transporter outer membrane subunit [Caulobacterales bacterium]
MSLSSKLFVPFLGSLVLHGCISVGPDYKRPETPAVESYLPADQEMPDQARLASNLPAGDWWKAFQSEDLNLAVQKGLQNSPTIAEADAVLDSAAAALRATRAADWPQADLNGAGARERINPAAFGFPDFPSVTLPRYSVGGKVSYDLDIFGGQRRAKESARARLAEEANRTAAARLTLAGNITQQALEIAALQAEIAAAQQIIASDQETLDLADRAIKLGSVPEATRLAPEAQLAADEAALPPLQDRLALTKNTLSFLLGEPPSRAQIPNFSLVDFSPPADTPIAIPSDFVRGRPDIRASEAALEAATARIGMAKADLFPHLVLSANVTQMTDVLTNVLDYKASAWRFGGDLTAPLFHGGELRAKVKGAEADARAANARYRGAVLRAFVEVANALSGLRYDTDTLTAQQKALQAAEANMRAQRRLYELGRGTLLEALDAQRQANLARRQVAAAQGARLQSMAALYAASATIDPLQVAQAAQ